jgi:hypothetical protein
MIHVINIAKESYPNKNYFYIGRSKFGNILGNPYSHLPEDKCLAVYKCKDRDEAINNYALYFDAMYGHNVEFTKAIDEIYEKYKNGEEVYLGCWCHPQRCHGDIIKEKLQQMLIKEKIRERKKNA